MQALAPSWLYHPYYAVAAFGYLGVDVFFILSGFVLAMNYAAHLQQPEQHQGHVLKFFWARFALIYPVHLFTLLLLIPAAMVLWHLSVASEPGRFTRAALLSNLFMVQA